MPIVFAVVVALALALAGPAAPAQAFTAADVKGWYAFGFEGLENGDRVVATGVMRLDGVSAVTGRWSMRRDGGGQCTGTILNSVYRINADGTGFFALGFFPDPPCTASLAIHFASAARSVGNFDFSSTQGTFSGRATRRGAGPFTTAGLAGTYAFHLSGPEGFTQTVATGVFPDVCAFAEAVPLSIAVFRNGRGFELASTFNALYSGTARLQAPPAP